MLSFFTVCGFHCWTVSKISASLTWKNNCLRKNYISNAYTCDSYPWAHLSSVYLLMFGKPFFGARPFQATLIWRGPKKASHSVLVLLKRGCRVLNYLRNKRTLYTFQKPFSVFFQIVLASKLVCGSYLLRVLFGHNRSQLANGSNFFEFFSKIVFSYQNVQSAYFSKKSFWFWNNTKFQN